jgi:uncharacterized protein (DUF2062 family)
MSFEEPRNQDDSRFARRARAKKLLRFLPRRAVMHKYPIIGRFADAARRRAYLWSFRTEHMRPSFYVGSILALMPFMGVQLPIALVLSLVLRTNFMVMGGLQFITNPFTAAPIYYATHQLGAKIISVSGFGQSIEVVEDEPSSSSAAEGDSMAELESAASPDEPPPIHWTRRVGTAINALVIGGIVSGTILGAVLDLLWKYTSAVHHPSKMRRPRRDSHSTETRGPPQ